MDYILSYFRKPAFIIFFYLKHPLHLLYLFQTVDQASKQKITKQDKVSIIITTHNAFDYIRLCIDTLQKTKYKNKEIIVVDNNSNQKTTKLLMRLKQKKFITKLHLSKQNNFFTRGNNIGASLSAKDSKYILLLNSDIKIENPDWLSILMINKPRLGVISFGKIDIPAIRPDGWCFMVNKQIFLEFNGLNEYYKMDWSITEFTAKVLKAGYQVKSIVNPNEYVYHFGQKSRPRKSPPEFNHMSLSQVITLFKGTHVDLLKV